MLPDPLSAVLLDFDHTLSHLGHFVRWDDARNEMLPVYRAAGLPEPFLQTHDGALNLYREVAASGLLPEPRMREVQREASRVLEAFELEAVPQAPLLPAAVDFVRRLPGLGLRAGIVTSNTVELVSASLERDGLAAAFEAIVGRNEVALLKPSPEGILRCCEAMALAPERCIYAGDNSADIEAARAAGMPGFGIRDGNSSEEDLLRAGAAAVFDDLAGLLDLIAGW